MRAARSSDNDVRFGAKIVEAYVRHNHVSLSELPRLVEKVCSQLASLGNTSPAAEPLRPAVPLKDAVSAKSIACLECGRRVLLLHRHIRDHHELTPKAYISRWGLPAHYPMVAPDYSAVRSAIAKKAIAER
ncbi:MucR family transcriptional regulator [Pseudorhizobium flavum]|uniref:MucR family transcriptional regulator n=1 Tax=Pseudorhizobium flavum TaxID=1335061 RepID=UPI003CD0DB5C